MLNNTHIRWQIINKYIKKYILYCIKLFHTNQLFADLIKKNYIFYIFNYFFIIFSTVVLFVVLSTFDIFASNYC